MEQCFRPIEPSAYRDKATGGFYISLRSIPSSVIKNNYVVPLYEGEALPEQLAPEGYRSWYDAAVQERVLRVKVQRELDELKKSLVRPKLALVPIVWHQPNSKYSTKKQPIPIKWGTVEIKE